MRRAVFPPLLLVLLIVAPLLAAAPAVRAQSDGRWEIGPRLVVLNAGGEPANDLMGFGAALRYRLNERWRLGFALDSITGDYERPYELVGLPSAEEIDSTLDALVWSAWIERETGGPERRLRWYWNLGLGAASTETEDVRGPLPGIGFFDITTDAGTEILAGGGAGFRLRLGASWNAEAGLRLDRHFAEWDITDRVSGRIGEIDDYTVAGLIVGVGYRF